MGSEIPLISTLRAIRSTYLSPIITIYASVSGNFYKVLKFSSKCLVRQKIRPMRRIGSGI